MSPSIMKGFEGSMWVIYDFFKKPVLTNLLIKLENVRVQKPFRSNSERPKNNTRVHQDQNIV